MKLFYKWQSNRTLLTPFRQVKYIVMNNSECDKQSDFLPHRFIYPRMTYWYTWIKCTGMLRRFFPGSLLPSERERVSLRDLCTIHNANPVYANIIAAELVWQRARSSARRWIFTGKAFNVAPCSLERIHSRFTNSDLLGVSENN